MLRSLRTRLALLLIGLLVSAQFGIVAIGWRYGPDVILERLDEATASTIQATAHLIAATPPPQRPRLLQSLSSERTRLLDDASFERTEHMHVDGGDERLEHALGQMLGNDIQVGRAGRDEKTLWIGFMADGERYWFGMRLPDLRYAVPKALGGAVGLLLLLTALGVVYVVWQLSRPLSELRDGILAQGQGLKPVPLPTSSPTEVRDLAHAFNGLIDRLAQRDRERNTLLAGVSHDLRAPLARLRARAESADDASLCDAIVRDVGAMSRIIDQFLSFVRSHGGSDERCRLDEAARRVVAEYHEHGLPVELRVDASARAPVSLGAIERVMRNLIDNAIEYGAPPVVIAIRQSAQEVLLEVSDHGRGMDAVQFEQALEPFSRLDTARGGKGHCGLGLAIVRRIAQDSGAQVRCSAVGTAPFVITVAWRRRPDDAAAQETTVGEARKAT